MFIGCVEIPDGGRCFDRIDGGAQTIKSGRVSTGNKLLRRSMTFVTFRRLYLPVLMNTLLEFVQKFVQG